MRQIQTINIFVSEVVDSKVFELHEVGVDFSEIVVHFLAMLHHCF